MDDRLTLDGIMTLPMTRRDIADYLGLTIETVSRSLAELRAAGMLKFLGKTQRELLILDRGRLRSFEVTRELPV